MHVLIEVSRILEGADAHHVAWSLKFEFSFPRWDLEVPTEEKKIKRKYRMKKQGIGF